TVIGTLHASDDDSPSTFVAQNNVAETYGTFFLATDGTWSYHLDNTKASVESLNVGDTRHEDITVATADGTTQSIDITIEGRDDTPFVVTEELAGSVTEQVVPTGNLSVSGVITFGDVDVNDVHHVSLTPVGTTLGAVTAVIDSDSTGTGTGGKLTWTY